MWMRMAVMTPPSLKSVFVPTAVLLRDAFVRPYDTLLTVCDETNDTAISPATPVVVIHV